MREAVGTDGNCEDGGRIWEGGNLWGWRDADPIAQRNEHEQRLTDFEEVQKLVRRSSQLLLNASKQMHKCIVERGDGREDATNRTAMKEAFEMLAKAGAGLTASAEAGIQSLSRQNEYCHQTQASIGDTHNDKCKLLLNMPKFQLLHTVQDCFIFRFGVNIFPPSRFSPRCLERAG